MSIQFARPDTETNSVAAAGTAAGTAAALKSGINTLTVAASQRGGVLPSVMVSPVYVRVVSTGSAATVYPPVGGRINGGNVTSGGVTMAAAKTGIFWPHPNGLDYTFLLTA